MASGNGLSAREDEVLALLARGMSSREIGVRLGIAEPTVKSHLASAYRKLGVANRVEAAVAYLGASHTNG